MKLFKLQNLFVIILAVLAGFATFSGIHTRDNSPPYYFKSIRGQDVLIYGKGLYKHMSADVAIQGIAQDYITLFVAIPLLLLSLILINKGHRLWKYIFTSIIGYFLITYLMYLNMAMYNRFFLIYIAVLGLSFFALINRLINDSNDNFNVTKNENHIFENAGKFLMVNALLIGLLWLSVVVPPLIDGSIVPLAVAHYTTLTVQGIDLSLLLPLSFIAGYLAWKNKPRGYYFTLIYCMTLTLLMTALSSKIIFMAREGVSVIPAIFIIPTITLTALYFSIKMLRSLKK